MPTPNQCKATYHGGIGSLRAAYQREFTMLEMGKCKTKYPEFDQWYASVPDPRTDPLRPLKTLPVSPPSGVLTVPLCCSSSETPSLSVSISSSFPPDSIISSDSRCCRLPLLEEGWLGIEEAHEMFIP